MLKLLFVVLGFNPLELAGVPNGFGMHYFLVSAFAVSAAVAAAWKLSQRGNLFPLQVGLVATTVVSLFLASALHEVKFVEFVGDTTQIRGEPPTKSFVVPTPFDLLDTEGVRDYGRDGKYANSTIGMELYDRVMAPRSIAATYVTVIVHLLLVATGLAALAALITFAALSLRQVYRERKARGA